SEVSGRPVLPLSVRETLSRYNYRRQPHSEKTTVLGQRAEGIDEMVDKRSMQVFAEDVLREVDLYGNDINLLQNRFVSPLSRIGVDFYKFYLTDTVEIDGERCIVLSFYPHNKAAFGFSGHLYVPEGDTTMFIKRVDMRVPRDINLNFVNNLLLSQTFVKAPDGTRLKTRDDLVMEASLMPGMPELYVRRLSILDSHGFDAPADSSVFGALGRTLRSDSADLRGDDWWQQARLNPMDAKGEGRVGLLMKRLRSVSWYSIMEKVVRTMVVGYVPTGNPNKIDIGPLNTFVSYNGIEGLRLSFGAISTANLNKRLFARAKGAYGFKDHKWKYALELEYSFRDKEYHSREFPIHSLRFNSGYNLDFIGQHYYFTNPDNLFLSLKRMSDKLATYNLKNDLTYILELPNNFSVQATAGYERRYATPMVPFVDGFGRSYHHIGTSSLSVELRYAPGEKFYQTTSQRIPINLDAPVFSLRHTLALKGVAGTTFGINKTEFNFQKRFWMSAFGYLDTMLGAGHVWDSSVFTALLMPNANMSYTIQPESFALINPMEFVNDSQMNWDMSYWANGAILNFVPYLKKLRLREVVSF
ncbi:MAG: carboxypeptidase-like regulatory domain-containing protein, partial [Muribaculaceae bacterium]|nr:carboxypeptidase-like regulatory domain-containing protein [Muribaculaceae bacterium]